MVHILCYCLIVMFIVFFFTWCWCCSNCYCRTVLTLLLLFLYLFISCSSSQGSINSNAIDTMQPLCKLVNKRMNAKAFIKAKHARAGEGKNCAAVRAQKKRNRQEERVRKRQNTIEDIRAAMRATGEIILCNSKCPTTGRYCKGIFLHHTNYEKHIKNGKHRFPIGINARDKILLIASRPGGLMCLENRPDRSSSELHSTLVAADNGSIGEIAARSFGMFNRKENIVAYKKPPTLLRVLEELYILEPKLRASEMRACMRTMLDEQDGGLLFCWSKRSTTGILLTEDQIQSWINTRTQKKKTKTNGKQTEVDK